MERMWKLCKSREFLGRLTIYASASATRESYFGHQLWCSKRMSNLNLGLFSTFPNHLLLLLVL